MAIVVEETIGIDGLVATVGDNIDELYSMATQNKKDIKKLKRLDERMKNEKKAMINTSWHKEGDKDV